MLVISEVQLGGGVLVQMKKALAALGSSPVPHTSHPSTLEVDSGESKFKVILALCGESNASLGCMKPRLQKTNKDDDGYTMLNKP